MTRVVRDPGDDLTNDIARSQLKVDGFNKPRLHPALG